MHRLLELPTSVTFAYDSRVVDSLRREELHLLGTANCRGFGLRQEAMLTLASVIAYFRCEKVYIDFGGMLSVSREVLSSMRLVPLAI
jgi:hypothetical protein